MDVERIAQLDPDLIVGTLSDTLPWRDQLSLIAPTLFYDPMNGQEAVSNYRDIANWIGQTNRFQALYADYRQRVEELAPALRQLGTTYTVIVPEPKGGTVLVFRDYGSITVVLNDLGFRHGRLTDRVPAHREGGNFSAEMIGMMDTDLIVTSHTDPDLINGTGEMLAQLDRIAPQASSTLPAVRSGRFVSLSRFHTYPPVFAAMHHVLDDLQDMSRR